MVEVVVHDLLDAESGSFDVVREGSCEVASFGESPRSRG
jgi:hypothetical protein